MADHERQPALDEAPRVVVGVFERREDGEAAVATLRERGWSEESISFVHRDPGAAPNLGTNDTQAESSAGKGALIGGALGGSAGLALGLGALAIPGLGPLIAVGPLAATLAGLGAGAGAGALIGSFAGLGIPDREAKEYEAVVREGGFFVSISAENAEQVQELTSFLVERRASGINDYDPRF